ncbi:hypothetical protein C1645_837055 [Glomus cerebriforme]|uniref:Uncharacterized protein n=1 Tax=Glomus cerebriforme TaxID=658196 RepID=A0A397S4V3_9GLOM|nr:hypothetical protein C1645_837055 [Glomus cerebriforme]
MKYLLFTVIICIIYALTGAIASPIDNARSTVPNCVSGGQRCNTNIDCCNKVCFRKYCLATII